MANDDHQIGSLALQRGWITQEQLAECLLLRKDRARDGAAPLVGEILVERGYLNPERLQALVVYQERYRVTCPHCDAKLLAPELPPGARTKCRKCGKEMILGGAGKQAQKPPSLPSQPQAGADPFVGQTLHGYRVESKLGAGGMGVVYKATQMNLNRTVALKILNTKSAMQPDFAERFKREAQAAARLNHTNIVQVHDAGQEGDYLFFSMEFVEGESLAALLARTPKLPLTKAVRIIRDAARALAYAHQHGVIHRDVKPDNIMLATDGQVKLADLGLAKIKAEDSADRSLTISGTVIGTPYYMSPEQTRDTRSVDARSDIYSLGATFFHILTGRFPFEGETAVQVMVKIQKGPSPEPRAVDPSISEPVNRVIARMMAMDPKDRFQSAQGVVEALEAVERGSPVPMAPARAATAAAPAARPPSRPMPAALLAAGGVALAAIAYVAGRAGGKPQLAEPPPRAVAPPPKEDPKAAHPGRAPETHDPREERPAEAAASAWPLFEHFFGKRPQDAAGQAALLEGILAKAPEGSADTAQARKALEEIRGRIAEAERGEARAKRLRAFSEGVEAHCAKGAFPQAVAEVEKGAADLDLASTEGFKETVAGLHRRIEDSAAADLARLSARALDASLEEKGYAKAIPLLEQALPRYAPFRAVSAQCADLLERMRATAAAPPAPPPPDETRPKPPAADTPAREDPPRRKKRGRVETRSYFSGSQQLDDWLLFPDMGMMGPEPGAVPNMREWMDDIVREIKDGGLLLRGKNRETMMAPFILVHRSPIEKPWELQFVWTPWKDSREGEIEMFLESAEKRSGLRTTSHVPFVRLRRGPKGALCEFPFLQMRNVPPVELDLHDAYRITLTFEEYENNDAKLHVEIHPGKGASSKRPLKELDIENIVPPPKPRMLGFRVQPNDIVGEIRIEAKDFLQPAGPGR